ncbi:MAG: hypothetical protein ABIL89_03025 [candidate division WOR-3 bacterium]
MAQLIYSSIPIVSAGIGIEKILDKTITIDPRSYIDLNFDKAIQTKEFDIIYIYIDNNASLEFSLIRELEAGIIQEQPFGTLTISTNIFIKQTGMFYRNGDMARGNRFALTNTQYYKLRIYNQGAYPATLTIKIWLERQL